MERGCYSERNQENQWMGSVNPGDIRRFRLTYLNAVALYVHFIDYAGGGDYEITIPMDHQYFSVAELLVWVIGTGRLFCLFT